MRTKEHHKRGRKRARGTGGVADVRGQVSDDDEPLVPRGMSVRPADGSEPAERSIMPTVSYEEVNAMLSADQDARDASARAQFEAAQRIGLSVANIHLDSVARMAESVAVLGRELLDAVAEDGDTVAADGRVHLNAERAAMLRATIVPFSAAIERLNVIIDANFMP